MKTQITPSEILSTLSSGYKVKIKKGIVYSNAPADFVPDKEKSLKEEIEGLKVKVKV